MANNRQNLPIDGRFRPMTDPNMNERSIVSNQIQQPPFFNNESMQSLNLDSRSRMIQRGDPQYYPPQDLNGQYHNQQIPQEPRFDHANYDSSVGRPESNFQSGPPLMHNPLMQLRNPTPPPRPPIRENKYS